MGRGQVETGSYSRTFLPRLESDAVYYEPFLGAGSLFFAVQPQRAILGDENRALVECFRCIRRGPEAVWRRLRRFLNLRGEVHYYRARERFNRMGSSYGRAALFIYLNKTCFNGIWRVNREGEFNVPFGGKDEPAFPTLEDLRGASIALRQAKILHGDFEETADTAKAGDFVYLDPPYPPLNGTAYFTHYTKDRFGVTEQHRVANLFKELSKRGCKVLISNADTPLVRSLYAGCKTREIVTQRWVASHGRRYVVRDLAISNYEL